MTAFDRPLNRQHNLQNDNFPAEIFSATEAVWTASTFQRSNSLRSLGGWTFGTSRSVRRRPGNNPGCDRMHFS
jgi:hypothetical protein